MRTTKTYRQVILLFFLFSIIQTQAQMPKPALVGYWHAWGNLNLTSIDNNYNVIMLSFLEADKNSSADDNKISDLEFVPLQSAATIKSQIKTLQSQGKKVLFSIGGAYGSFRLNNSTDKNTFVTKVKSFITEYGVDGIDIDIERSVYMCNPSGSLSSPASYMQNLIDGVKELLTWYQSTYNKKMLLTTAPETAYTTGGISPWAQCNGAFLPFIEQLRNDIDLLMIQLYNSGEMYSLGYYSGNKATYKHGTVDFVITQTEAAIKGFSVNGPNVSGTYSGLDESKIAVALPACSSAGSGYLTPTNMKAAVNYIMGCGSKPGSYTLSKSYPNLGGIMTWSIDNDANSSCGGAYTFAKAVGELSCFSISKNIAQTSLNDIKIFPNPVDQTLTVNTSNLLNETLLITDVNGKIILTEKISNDQIQINTSNLNSGVYFLRIGNNYQKFIKK